jgi:hypothetical protein
LVLLAEANRSDQALPSFREARSTSFGQVDEDIAQQSAPPPWTPPATFLDDSVPERLRSSAGIALVELRHLGASDAEIREILSVPNGAAPLGIMESNRESNPGWAKRLSDQDRRQWIDGLIQFARDEGSRLAQG